MISLSAVKLCNGNDTFNKNQTRSYDKHSYRGSEEQLIYDLGHSVHCRRAVHTD